jgi:predicted PilT family ATPase
MAMEDDYGMVDGIINNGPKATVAELEQQAKTGQPISLLELAEASRRESAEKKKSVVERLRNQPVSREHKKTAPDRGAEMER